MEDKIMRKTNNTVANNNMRRINSESYDHYQLRIITTDPQGSKEVLVKNYKKVRILNLNWRSSII